MALFYSKKDLQFQLFENLNCIQLTEIPFFSDHNEETFKLILDAAERITEKSLPASDGNGSERTSVGGWENSNTSWDESDHEKIRDRWLDQCYNSL